MDELKTLSNALSELQKAVVRIETKLEIHSDHELRIRKLETTMAKNAWMGSMLTATMTAASVVIVKLLIQGVINP